VSNNDASKRAKGAIFETVVKKLLQKNEYAPCKVDNEQVDNRGRVRGRGEWHQIDALGRWKFTLPFVYPIRLLCEAKCWNNPVGLSVVRNFVGVVKDIAENYFVEDGQDLDRRMFSKRYTDCGAIFSVGGFTKPAQRYAYAQGVFLVSYENNPIINEIRQNVESLSRFVELTRGERKTEFLEWFGRSWDNYSSVKDRYVLDREEFAQHLRKLKGRTTQVRTSVVGVASGVYPLHLLSYQEIPPKLFDDADDTDFRVHYHKTERGHYFDINPSNLPDAKLYFSMPEVILSKYRQSMRRFKMDFLKWIDVPTTLRGKRRILRLQLDTEWLLSLR